MSRVQLALNVSNVDEAVEFYRRLFGAEPAKRRPGYANFAIADPPLKLVLIEIDAPDADATGYEPIHHDGRRIGYVTSGAYGHHVRRSLALAYVDTACSRMQDPLSVTIIGVPRAARILGEPPYDPSGSRLRG